MQPPGCFAFYAPKMYKRYEELMDLYVPRDMRPFSNSVFPATTFNLGPKVETVEHYDSKNKTEGWIAVTALGNFNPQIGGHLILRELGLVVEFPAGSTVLFPSAIIRHGNVPVLPHETRDSLTQFATAGLFRYAEYGFKTEEEFKAADIKGWEQVVSQRKMAWGNAVENYSTYEALHSDREEYLFGNSPA